MGPKQKKVMSASQKNLTKYWIYFAVSVGVCLLSFVVLPEWCWVTFPFICTYFVQALDWM